MTVKSRIFSGAVRVFESAVRLFGRDFYWRFMPKFAQHLNLVYETSAAGKTVYVHCAGDLAHDRAQRLLTKEPDIITWINGFKSDDVFLDIGANVGIYTLYASAVRGLRTIPVEPSGPNIYGLMTNIRLNKIGAITYPMFCVLGETKGFVRIPAHPFSYGVGGSIVMKEGLTVQKSGWDEDIYDTNLPSVTADELAFDSGAPFPVHMKIDVVCATLSVLRGAERCLSDSRLKSVMIRYPVDKDHVRQIKEIMTLNGFEPDSALGTEKLKEFFKRSA